VLPRRIIASAGDNPLAALALTTMRDSSTESPDFQRACTTLGTVLAVETARLLSLEKTEIETPLEPTIGYQLKDNICLIPILRAGLGLLEPFNALFPGAPIGQIGIRRDEETLEAEVYLEKMPDSLIDHTAIILDPMLATGHSLVEAIKIVKKYAPRRILVACAVSAPEGIRTVQEDFPEVAIITGALDRELNDDGYILPGLGDAGDRLFGTV